MAVAQTAEGRDQVSGRRLNGPGPVVAVMRSRPRRPAPGTSRCFRAARGRRAWRRVDGFSLAPGAAVDGQAEDVAVGVPFRLAHERQGDVGGVRVVPVTAEKAGDRDPALTGQ